MTSFFLRSVCCALLVIGSAWAQTTPQKTSAAPALVPSAIEWVNGEVTQLDAARSRITLKHAPIASIKMDAMTMPFKVKDKALLEGRKVGEKVQFAVRVDDGDLFLIQMRSAP
jgi:Cu(I)/Ag(I) efflux system periplasmic protein CusF